MKKTNGGRKIKSNALLLTIFMAIFWIANTFIPTPILKLPIIVASFAILYYVLYGIGDFIDSICKIKDTLLGQDINSKE